MKKFTKTQFYVLSFIGMIIILILFGFTWDWQFPGDWYGERWGSKTLKFGAVHILTNMAFGVSWVVIAFWLGIGAAGDSNSFERFYGDDNDEYKKAYTLNKLKFNMKLPFKIKFRKLIWITIGILIVVYGFKFGKSIYGDSVTLYNASVTYQSEYNKKVQERVGFYDKLWKTYFQKEKITNLNKETFIKVTKIIMENRADGENVQWKWLQENQNIPLEEFTRFYADLSTFITSQREGYFKIERQCQEIANKNNIMLDTFPNNIYNRWLNREKINFEYGFLSDSTNAVFESGIENIK